MEIVNNNNNIYKNILDLNELSTIKDNIVRNKIYDFNKNIDIFINNIENLIRTKESVCSENKILSILYFYKTFILKKEKEIKYMQFYEDNYLLHCPNFGNIEEWIDYCEGIRKFCLGEANPFIKAQTALLKSKESLSLYVENKLAIRHKDTVSNKNISDLMKIIDEFNKNNKTTNTFTINKCISKFYDNKYNDKMEIIYQFHSTSPEKVWEIANKDLLAANIKLNDFNYKHFYFKHEEDSNYTFLQIFLYKKTFVFSNITNLEG